MAFPLVAVKLSERLGFDSCGPPKTYGTDAMTPRAWLAVQTSAIRLGTAIAEVGERPLAGCASPSGKVEKAAAAVPDEFIDDQALMGPPEPVLERYGSWADCGLTRVYMSSGQPEDMELMAESSELSVVPVCAQIGPELHVERTTSEWRSIRMGDADALG